MSATQPASANLLMDLISTLLAPMFLIASNGDIALAQTAAIQTMNAYRIQHQTDLLAVAQIVAFSLATLGSLALSMGDDLSLSLILRLRGNANACSRSAEQHRRALQASNQAPQPAAEPHDQPAATTTQPTQAPLSAPTSGTSVQPPRAPAMPMTADQQHRAMRAAAFAEAAAECPAEIPHLPPLERKAALVRATAQGSSAIALLSGIDLAPYRLQPATPPKGVKPR